MSGVHRCQYRKIGLHDRAHEIWLRRDGRNLSGEPLGRGIDIVHLIALIRIPVQIERKRDQHSKQ
jgi:hypothetical protein